MIKGRWIFLTTVAVLYSVLSFFNFELAKDAFSKSLSLFQQIIPVFALVFILMFVSGLFLNTRKIVKIVGGSSGIKGWFIAVVGGILSTGPIYVWYPFLAELKEKGMKNGLIAVFLYNRAVKIPLLPVMVYYFGLAFTVVLTCYMILFSIVNGILVDKLLKLK